MYICTLDEIKAQIGIDDTEEDAALTIWVDGLESRFERYLQRKLLRQVDREQYFSGRGDSRVVYLDLFPVESITEVTIEEQAHSGYGLIRNRGRLLYSDVLDGTSWPYGDDNIRVVWTGGYVAAGEVVGAGQHAMPDDIRRALILQVSYEWRHKEQIGLKSVGMDGTNISMAPASLLMEVKDSLGPYRRIL